jgi:hypothetical protein
VSADQHAGGGKQASLPPMCLGPRCRWLHQPVLPVRYYVQLTRMVLNISGEGHGRVAIVNLMLHPRQETGAA